MSFKRAAAIARRWLRAGIACLTLFQFSMGASLAGAQSGASAKPQPNRDAKTTTPIKHVIVIIGENRTFDHVYGTYKPKEGETISNLRSKGIVNADGTPGPNYSLSAQFSALDSTTSGTDSFSNSPQSKSIYGVLPPALAGGNEKASDTNPAPFKTLQVAELADQGLAPGYNKYLITGATGIAPGKVDTRIKNATYLREGVFQISGSKMPYDAYTASPVHRFFQMWQQIDCNVDYATKDNPSGCLSDLFPWVETTVGTGSNGQPQPSNFTNTTTGEGSTAMAFYNMAQGDAPYFKQLADEYTISDNFHQSVMGGTGANHIMFGHADALWFSTSDGKPAAPPNGVQVFGGTPDAGVVNMIENPNPAADTNNWYTEDGYGNSFNSGFPPPFSVSPASGAKPNSFVRPLARCLSQTARFSPGNVANSVAESPSTNDQPCRV